jgi:PKD repeat protein
MADKSIASDVVSYGVSTEEAKAVFRNCVVDASTAPNETCASASSAATLVDAGNGNFYLAPGSSAINFGRAKENEATGDLDLNERVIGSAIDAGCYEYNLNAFAIAFEADIVSGILPVDVTFTASVGGVNEGDMLQYIWDFNGDGEADATVDGEDAVQYRFAVGGIFSPSLTVKNLTAQTELSISKSNYLQFAPRVLYVNKDAESHVVPFATPETGALTVNEAIAAAVDGCEIVIYPGTYGVASTLKVEKVLDIHGLLSNPESVVLTRAGNSWFRIVEMNKTESKLSNVVIEKGALSGSSGAGVHFGDLGGTVSNVIICGCFASNYNGAGGAAYLASEHALLTHSVISNCYVQTMNGAGGTKGVLQVEKGRAENCLVTECYCPFGISDADAPGNAVHIGANGSVVNCTIVRNTMETRGIVYVSSSTSRMINCVVAGNTKSDSHDTVFFGGSVSDPSACVLNCVIDPEDLSGTFKDYANGDYTPNPAGPLYNAGVTPENAPSVDLAGKKRVQGKSIDIGSFEALPTGLAITIR